MTRTKRLLLAAALALPLLTTLPGASWAQPAPARADEPAPAPARHATAPGSPSDASSAFPNAAPHLEEPPVDLLGSPAREEVSRRGQFFDLTLGELLNNNLVSKAQLFGYLRTNWEKRYRVPSRGPDGATSFESTAGEWDFPAFHLYGVTRPSPAIEVLFNLRGTAERVEVRNAYGNLTLSPLLQLRAGRMYRRFDLFNEKLDQAPAFLGIEVPELFDRDHLMVPRYAIFSIHGYRTFRDLELSYELDTDNPEGGAAKGVFPLGFDLRVRSPRLVAGLSGYLSSVGAHRNAPSVAIGEGPATGGVLPWMKDDRYVVAGGFAEIDLAPLVLQGGYWLAHHSATRDPAAVLSLLPGGLNDRQRRRFFGDAAGAPDDELGAADVVPRARFLVHSAYLRAGYTFSTRRGTLTPYALFDVMSHPELIASKAHGGDGEAGLADDGRFYKPTLGLVYKPYNELVIKLDASLHTQKFNGAYESYPEIRADLSYAFELLE